MEMGRFEKNHKSYNKFNQTFLYVVVHDFIKQGIVGVEKMAPRLRALTALAKYPSSISCIHLVANNQL